MRYLRESLIAGLLLVASTAGAEPSAADLEHAKKAFSTGLALLKDPESPRYDEALVHFQRAYDLSGSWKALGNLALCLFKLERDGAAIAAYEKYLELGGKKLDPADRAQAERDLESLRAQVVTVDLVLPEPGVAVIDERLDVSGRQVVNEYAAESTSLKLGLHPGRHTLTAKLSSGDVRWETRLEPASSASHEFVKQEQREAEPSAPVSRGRAVNEDKGTEAQAGPGFDLRIPAYASFGVAAVGVGAGILFALKSQDSRAQADDLCNGNQCPLSRRDEIRGLQEDANDQGRLAWIGFAVGGIGAAAGVTLIVIDGQRAKPETAAGVRAFVGLGGAGLRGRF